MTPIMRRTVRGAAAGLGAFAIVAGTAACGGLIGGDTDEEGPSVEEEDPAGDDGAGGTDEEADPADDEGDDAENEDDGENSGFDFGDGDDADDADGVDDSKESDGSDDADDAGDSADGDDTAGALSEDDLTAVGDRYYEFLQAAAESDGTAACSMILNPFTDQPIEGSALEACAEGFEGETENSELDPSVVDSLDRSMFEGVDNGDGTAGATLLGQDSGITFIQGDDGDWYIDGSDYI